MEKFNLDKAARKELIQKEFREALTRESMEVPEHTDAVVVLSGKEFVFDEAGNLDQSHPHNQENEDRLKTAIKIAEAVAAKEQVMPRLVLNGTTEQLPTMRDLAIKLGWPEDQIDSLDCGPAGVGNTKTQFEVAKDYSQQNHWAHLTFVTSSYHVPRTERTADAQLEPDQAFDVVAGPSDLSFDVYKTVRGEVKRISSYAAKGDVSINKRRPT